VEGDVAAAGEMEDTAIWGSEFSPLGCLLLVAEQWMRYSGAVENMGVRGAVVIVRRAVDVVEKR